MNNKQSMRSDQPSISREAACAELNEHFEADLVRFWTDDLWYCSWIETFGSTAGPFGGIGGQALTNFRLEAWVADHYAVVFCGDRILGVSDEFEFKVHHGINFRLNRHSSSKTKPEPTPSVETKPKKPAATEKIRVSFRKNKKERFGRDSYTVNVNGTEAGRITNAGDRWYWYSLNWPVKRNTYSDSKSAVTLEGCKYECKQFFGKTASKPISTQAEKIDSYLI